MAPRVEPVDWAERIERHRQILAEGKHLFSGLRFSPVPLPDAKGEDEGDGDGDGPVRERVAMALEIDDTVTNPTGALQGGLVATFADIVGGTVAMQGLDPHSIVVTSDLTVHYLGGVTNGPAYGIGTVLRRGRSTVVVRVDIHDGPDGPLAAACQLAFRIVRPPAPEG